MTIKPMLLLIALFMGLGSLGCSSLKSFFSKAPSATHGEGTAAMTKAKGKGIAAKNIIRSKKILKAEESKDFQFSEKEKLFIELSGERIEQMSDADLYRKSMDYYRRGDSVGLDNFGGVLVRRFPKSIYSDNVLYLQGMMAFNQKKFGDSLTAFQTILDRYPKSNKAVSALYAKGVVFRKMNLDKVAVRMLAQVINDYPGTPESKKAQTELDSITR